MKKKAFTAVLCGLIVLTVLFIFSQSFLGVSTSQRESDSVLKSVTPILEVFVGRGNVTSHLVRKLAHFSEFFALGAQLSLLLWVQRAGRFQHYLNGFYLGATVALCDETIQLFTGRGSQVQDVWLDMLGALCGLLALLGLRALAGALRGGRTAKKQKNSE